MEFRETEIIRGGIFGWGGRPRLMGWGMGTLGTPDTLIQQNDE